MSARKLRVAFGLLTITAVLLYLAQPRDGLATIIVSEPRDFMANQAPSFGQLQLPGLVMNGRVYMLGARLTPEPPRAFVDLFFLSNKLFTTPSWYYLFSNRSAFDDEDPHVAHARKHRLMDWKQLVKSRISLQVAAPLALATECEHVREVSRDENTLSVIHTVRCPITLFDFSVHDNVTARVRIGHLEDYLLPFVIPTRSLAVGMGGPRNEGPVGFMQRRDVVQLCVAGLDALGEQFIADFVRHHLLVGISSFVLGVHAPEDSNVFAMYRHRLAFLINQGVVSLMSVHLPGVKHLNDRDEMKMLFYQACLFHGKAVAPYTAIWDVDELWTPPNAQMRSLNNSLIRALNEARDKLPGCPQWWYERAYQMANRALGLAPSFITFPSYQLSKFNFSKPAPAKEKTQQDVTVFDFKYRRVDMDWGYQKSIANSRMAFHAGFHVPGSCTNATGVFEVRLSKTTCAHRVAHLGVMRHLFSLTRFMFSFASEERLFRIEEKKTKLPNLSANVDKLYHPMVLDEWNAFVQVCVLFLL